MNTLLTAEEFDRLFVLLRLLNDVSVQMDYDELVETDRLLYKIRNDGDELR